MEFGCKGLYAGHLMVKDCAGSKCAGDCTSTFDALTPRKDTADYAIREVSLRRTDYYSLCQSTVDSNVMA